MEFTNEMIEKVKKAGSVEELVKISKENNVIVSEEDAVKSFSMFCKTGELSDDELDNVSGGGCDKKGDVEQRYKVGEIFYVTCNDGTPSHIVNGRVTGYGVIIKGNGSGTVTDWEYTYDAIKDGVPTGESGIIRQSQMQETRVI